jgi:hypothetical protein
MIRFFLILFLFTTSWARGPLDSLAFCSGINQCLKTSPNWCTEKLKAKNPKVDYHIDYCDDFVILNSLNVRPDSNTGTKQLYSLLGKQYRMEYPLEGILPVNLKMIEFLMANLDFTTQLINAYENTKYSAKYTNRKKTKFRGNNGGALSGKFEFLKSEGKEGQYVVVGEGFAKVLKWKLKGDAVLIMDFDALSDRDLAFDIKCMAFPGNSVINKIMELNFFEKKVMEFIQVIVDDITQAAYRFADGDRKAIKSYKPLQTKHFKKKLEEFEKVIKESNYFD